MKLEAASATEHAVTVVVERAPRRRVRPTRSQLLLLAIIALAAFLRFHHLGSRILWFDETFSATAVRLRWMELLRLFWAREGNMALYYVLLKFWMMLGGGTEFFIRTLSVIFSVATIPVIYLLGKRLFNEPVGLTAAALLAVNAFHVRYAQEARSYALLVLLCALSTLFFVEGVQTGSRRAWMAYSIASSLAVYSQFFGALIVAAQWLSLPLLGYQRFAWREWLRAARWFLYFICPILVFIVVRGSGSMFWIPPTTSATVLHFGQMLAGNGGTLLLAICGVPVVIALLAAILRRRDPGDRFRYGLIVSLCFVPVLITITASLLLRPMFIPRYVIVSLPGFVLLVAVGVWQLRFSPLRWTLLAVILVLSIQGTRSYYRQDVDTIRDDFRSATHWLLTHAEPNDALCFYTGPGRMSYEYYKWREKPASSPSIIYPNHGAELDHRDFLVTPLAEVFQQMPMDSKRVWLFLNNFENGLEPDKGALFMQAWLARQYRVAARQRFDGVELVLYSRE
jgi:uncharacterized membrane protein